MGASHLVHAPFTGRPQAAVVIEYLLAAVVVTGVVARVVMTAAQRRHLRAPASLDLQRLEGVTVLRPVKGVDPGLVDNLRSVFAQDYPRFEVIIGARDADDPALEVARKVASEFPQVRSVILADAREVGPNPKVANLANMVRFARYPVILISDSNVRLDPRTLRRMVATLHQPGVGLVSSPIRGVGAGSLGGEVDALLLNTFVMGGTAAVHRLLSGVCVVGKSMMLRRSLLEAMGGFGFLSQFLAEDQVCGEEVAARGFRVALDSLPVDNVTGGSSLGQVFGRYLRWARIRRRMAPLGFLGEPLLFPTALAVLGVSLVPATPMLLLWGLAAVVQTTLARASLRVLGLRQSWWKLAALVLLSEVVALAAWCGAWVSREVSWRGKSFRIGTRTRLEDLGNPPMPEVVAGLGENPA